MIKIKALPEGLQSLVVYIHKSRVASNEATLFHLSIFRYLRSPTGRSFLSFVGGFRLCCINLPGRAYITNELVHAKLFTTRLSCVIIVVVTKKPMI